VEGPGPDEGLRAERHREETVMAVLVEYDSQVPPYLFCRFLPAARSARYLRKSQTLSLDSRSSKASGWREELH
jgi:hypothetical protein